MPSFNRYVCHATVKVGVGGRDKTSIVEVEDHYEDAQKNQVVKKILLPVRNLNEGVRTGTRLLIVGCLSWDEEKKTHYIYASKSEVL